MCRYTIGAAICTDQTGEFNSKAAREAAQEIISLAHRKDPNANKREAAAKSLDDSCTFAKLEEEYFERYANKEKRASNVEYAARPEDVHL